MLDSRVVAIAAVHGVLPVVARLEIERIEAAGLLVIDPTDEATLRRVMTEGLTEGFKATNRAAFARAILAALGGEGE